MVLRAGGGRRDRQNPHGNRYGSRCFYAGGIKVGERAFVFVAEAESNEKLDRMLREIPFWGMVKWQVTPLESFETRAAEEREMTARLKGAKKQR